VTVTDEPDADSVTFCVAVAPTCVGLKLIAALFEVIVPTVGGTDLLPVTLLEHPVISSTETANIETVEYAVLDQRLIRLTMRYPSRPQGLSCSEKSWNANIMSLVLFSTLPVAGTDFHLDATTVR
jgi:hypothetical protein